MQLTIDNDLSISDRIYALLVLLSVISRIPFSNTQSEFCFFESQKLNGGKKHGTFRHPEHNDIKSEVPQMRDCSGFLQIRSHIYIHW